MVTLGRIITAIFCVGIIVTVKVGEGACDLINKVGTKAANAIKKVIKND